MQSYLGTALVLVGLIAVYRIILRAPRTGRAGWRDPIGKLGVPTSHAAEFMLGLLAVGHLVELTGSRQGLDAATGTALGGLGAVLIQYRMTRQLLGLVGIAAGLWDAVEFVVSPNSSSGLEGLGFRLMLVSLILACFVAGMGMGLLWLGRSRRIFALAGGHGLAFFGLVDAATFLASPGGADLLGLAEDRFPAYLAVAAIFALVVGLAYGPFTMWVLAILLTITNLALPLLGLAPTSRAGSLTMFGVAGIIGYAVVRAVLGRRLLWLGVR